MEKRIKVLVLATDVFKKGGVQRYIRYQIQALSELPGVERVFSFSMLGKDESNSFEGDFPLEYIAYGTSIIKKINFVMRAVSLSRKEKIGLVMCNHISLAPVALIIRALFGIPYAVNVYGLEIWSGKTSLLERHSLRAADGVIGDCKFILSYIKKNLRVSEDKTSLLYDAVDLERFRPIAPGESLYAKYEIPRGKKLVVTVGRLDRDKGHAATIRALKSLGDDVMYVVVGGGILMDSLKSLARDEGVFEKVKFLGRVPEEDLVPLYNISDAYVLVSRFGKGEGEGLPLGLIEASACAKPIIAGDEDGSAEAVSEGENGFVVSPHDNARIVEKIKFLLSDVSRAKQIGLNGRKFVESNFAYAVFKAKLSDIVKKTVG